MTIQLESIDLIIIAAYFFLVLGIAWYVSFGEKKETQNSDEYFLAGRNLGWFAIGASLFASNIGSEHLIGLAGSGASSGLAVSHFEILASFILLLLGWFFAPFYLKSGVTTMPEFLEMRYGKPARNYLSFISVVSYVITKISATIFAGAVVFEAIGLDFWIGAGVTVIATGLYTVLGGLRAVIYTDTMQVFIMIGGSLLLTFLGLEKIGGFSEIQATLEPSFLELWRPMSDPEFPWTGILFGAPILGVWYWCTDQFIVQRVLSAKNLSQARRGTLFAGYLKLLPMLIFVVPGMIALVLSQKGMLTLEKSDHALPALVASIMPVGIKGLVIAGLLAALMSSLSSVFNSCSTLITYDFYKSFYPQATEKELTRVGQISTVILVILGILWIPLMKYISGNLFTYIQSIQAYISPPIASIFLLGILFKFLNLKGAMTSLWLGFILGLTRLILEIKKTSLSGFWFNVADMNFLHYAIFMFITCSLVLLIVSYLSFSNKSESDLEKVLYKKGMFAISNQKRKTDLILSFILVAMIFLIWSYFS